MAQKTGQEETEFKSLTLCVNNCGVTGNPSTNNMCQNCFTTTTTASAAASSIISSSVNKFDKSYRSTILSAREDVSVVLDETVMVDLVVEKGIKAAVEKVTAKRVVNRCSGCKRKVGLTGFRCRCGELFCSEHRYSDRHDCNYDYKSAGREAIARENPVVRAAKIVKV